MHNSAIPRHPMLFRMDNNMNTPPNPPCPADEEARKRHDSLLRSRLLLHLKRTFPGLPY